MKINFENYEIVRADGLNTFYPLPYTHYDPKVTQEKIIERLYTRTNGITTSKVDMQQSVQYWATVAKGDDLTKMVSWAKTMNWSVTPDYQLYHWPQDIINNFGMDEKQLRALAEFVACMDDEDVKEMMASMPCEKTNADANAVMSPLWYNKGQIETQKELLERVNWGFRPSIGSFTVGHSLLQFDAPNGNKDVIPSAKSAFYEDCMVGQACTWQHDMDTFVGSVMNATTHPETNILLANTRFWESRREVADLVEEIKKKYDEKDLKFSFEILTARVACSVCGNEYPAMSKGKYEHYCDCLKGRFAPGSSASRILLDFLPIGEGVVDVPAYKGSMSLIAAHQTEVARLAQVVEQLTQLINKKVR